MQYDPNGKYLRQLTTGEIYGFEPEFAKRSDMVPFRPGVDDAQLEVQVIDTRRSAAAVSALDAPAPAEVPAAVAQTPDGFSGRGGLMGAILGDE